MKLKNVFSTSALLMAVFMFGCTKDLATNGSTGTSAPEKSAVLSSAEKTDGLQLKSGLLGSVDLKSAGDFVILSKTGITSVYKSTITGNIGTSPITGAAMVVNCGEVTGSVFSVDAAGPACKTTSATMLTAAVGDMQAAYTDAAGRINPDYLNLGAGNIGGKTLTAGLYKWTTALIIPTDLTISGAPDDIFIFQISGTLIMSSAVNITLAGGVQAKNIFWQTSGAVTLGTTSHFEGNILSQTGINMKTGASMNGRMLAQTAVTLQMNAVTKPQ